MNEHGLWIFVGICGVVMVVLLIVMIWQSRGFATRSELVSAEERIDSLAREAKRETKGEISDVHRRVDGLVKTLGPMKGTLDEMAKQNDRIEARLDTILSRTNKP